MCSNALENVNNALYTAENPTASLMITYGPYLNWGRWNHNPSRIHELIALLKQNFTVQLNHDEEEKDRRNHGYVTIIDTSDGSVIVHNDEVQHNRNYSNRKNTLKSMFDVVQEKYTSKKEEPEETNSSDSKEQTDAP